MFGSNFSSAISLSKAKPSKGSLDSALVVPVPFCCAAFCCLCLAYSLLISESFASLLVLAWGPPAVPDRFWPII